MSDSVHYDPDRDTFNTFSVPQPLPVFTYLSVQVPTMEDVWRMVNKELAGEGVSIMENGDWLIFSKDPNFNGMTI